MIESLGGEPVPASDYDFGITNVASAVRTAQVLENTGIKAHDGAIAYIERANLLTAVATIARVVARHASYLNLLNRDVPFPAPFDRAVAPRTICEVVRDAYITSSPKPYGPYKSLTALCNCLPNKPTPNVKGRSGDTWAGATAPALSLLAHPPCEEDRSSGAG